MYHKGLEYIRDEKVDRSVEGTILSAAQLNAWIITVVECFKERETRGGHCQKK